MAQQQSKNGRIVVWDLQWKLSPTEEKGYVSVYSRYLRIGLAPEADLLLDEQFKLNQESDYMSILATGYGAGAPVNLGEYKLVCQRAPAPYYNCGYKFLHDGRTYVLVFKDQPRETALVAELFDKAISFIGERSSSLPESPRNPIQK
jgi:hypothetical protein